MCEATTMAVLTIASAAASAYGSYRQGQTQEDIANYNAGVERVKAQDAIATGAIAEDQQRAKVRQFMGAQRASMGGSGAVVGAGSFGNILDQTAKFGEQDAQTIRANAMKTAWGMESQARADEFMGASAASAGRMGAATTLLSAAPQIYRSGKSAGWWGK